MSRQVDRIIANGTSAQSDRALRVYARYLTNMARVEDRRNPNAGTTRNMDARFTRNQYMGIRNALGGANDNPHKWSCVLEKWLSRRPMTEIASSILAHAA